MPKLVLPRKIKKRDGSVVPFEKEKIRYAVERFRARFPDRAAFVPENPALSAERGRAARRLLLLNLVSGEPS